MRGRSRSVRAGTGEVCSAVGSAQPSLDGRQAADAQQAACAAAALYAAEASTFRRRVRCGAVGCRQVESPVLLQPESSSQRRGQSHFRRVPGLAEYGRAALRCGPPGVRQPPLVRRGRTGTAGLGERVSRVWPPKGGSGRAAAREALRESQAKRTPPAEQGLPVWVEASVRLEPERTVYLLNGCLALLRHSGPAGTAVASNRGASAG